MTDILIDEKEEFNLRKEQALQLNIDIENDMTLESLEKEMHVASDNLNFEVAAEVRDRILGLKKRHNIE